MNAATARNNSMIANTRCRLLDCSEKPATNSAGATVAPNASPVSAEATRTRGWLAGSANRNTRMPAASSTMPTSGR